jgi:hypothetical protein
MKRVFLGAAVALSGLLVMAGIASAAWTANAGPHSITFGCLGSGTLYYHTIDTLVDDGSGTFSGTGHWNNDANYTWTINGTVAGTSVLFTIVYTGTNAGYTLNGVGTMAADGSANGTVDNNCQTFETGAAVFAYIIPPKDDCKSGGWADLWDVEGNSFKNQGDCVSYVATDGKNLGAGP